MTTVLQLFLFIFIVHCSKVIGSDVASEKQKSDIHITTTASSTSKEEDTYVVLNSTKTTTASLLTSTRSSLMTSEWFNDLINLPSNVPYPGINWLKRMNVATAAMSNNTSVYERMVLDFQTPASANDGTTIKTKTTIVNPCRNFNAYINSIFLSNDFAQWIVSMSGGSNEIGHYILCYIRNFIGAMIVYYGVAICFHYGCYVYYGKIVFDDPCRTRPTISTILDQIALSQLSMFLYVLLPVVDEYLVENNYTLAYYTIEEIGGWYWYLFYTILYFTVVEIGIYWMHRTLHTNKTMYKYIHLKHHKYNKAETLTPWASIAFHPLDGILQASPYVGTMFLVPCHYPTHVGMLFFTAMWATYIHDAMDWNVFPIMGSKYHTIHHTHYIYNYGQVFIFCDYIWGTLQTPTAPTGTTKKNV